MYLRIAFLILFIAGIYNFSAAQGLNRSFYTNTFKKDSVLIKKREEPKPLFSSVKYDYYQNLGAACKLEFKFEKATKVPLRLRLGSLQQTDYLEQKPNAIKPER